MIGLVTRNKKVITGFVVPGCKIVIADGQQQLQRPSGTLYGRPYVAELEVEELDVVDVDEKEDVVTQLAALTATNSIETTLGEATVDMPDRWLDDDQKLVDKEPAKTVDAL